MKLHISDFPNTAANLAPTLDPSTTISFSLKWHLSSPETSFRSLVSTV
ncbi:hypothetical protein COLO4_12309 [Corchorus olitorius]|uniref:Uncharacterized protein n=1 Tax=Corchorus olitorius TaxID=93759 RepID=A0A1R3K1A5_9ROSI|nr:hypothetical protein COLO4_12309 [Corchorus olitorius]